MFNDVEHPLKSKLHCNSYKKVALCPVSDSPPLKLMNKCYEAVAKREVFCPEEKLQNRQLYLAVPTQIEFFLHVYLK